MPETPSVSKQIDNIIKLHGGWKAATLMHLRTTITSADPSVFEEVKWKMATRPEGLPVWSFNGILCFAEIWKDNIKLIFPKGASLKDPKKLFNARLKSNTARSIEIRENQNIDTKDLQALVVEAIELNAKK